VSLPVRKNPRLAGYDYSTSNNYFVTTNVKDFVKCFGNIINGEMYLNIYGEIVEKQILWLEQQYSYVKILSFVVMPDHVHFILQIDKSKVLMNQKIKPLPQLLGAFKITSSKLIHRGGYFNFQWHRSFHDRIIRDSFELMRIQDYIYQNPKNWKATIPKHQSP